MFLAVETPAATQVASAPDDNNFLSFCYVERRPWLVSATAVRRIPAPYFRDPAVDDVGRTAAAVIRVDVNSLYRAIFSACAALHAAIAVGDLGFAILDSENAVRTDRLAAAATDTFFHSQQQNCCIVQISEVFHYGFPFTERSRQARIKCQG